MRPKKIHTNIHSRVEWLRLIDKNEINLKKLYHGTNRDLELCVVLLTKSFASGNNINDTYSGYVLTVNA